MAILFILLLFVFLLPILRFIVQIALRSRIEKSREIIYNDNILINYYSKNVILSEEDMDSWQFNEYDKIIKDEEQYKENIKKIANDLYESDIIGNRHTVNLLAKFLVKYYTEPIINFGNDGEKKMLRNMVILLVANGFINESEDDK